MFYRYSKEGVPMIKPLVFFDQEDPQTHFRTDEFIFGEQILVCPVQEPNAQGRRMYIPRGTWYNYWTDEVVLGGMEKWISAEMDKIPLFVKEGAIIPKYPVQQYVGELEIKELLLEVYYKNGVENSSVYEDAQDGYDYKKGRFSLRNFSFRGKDKELIIQQFKEGAFITTYETFKLNFHGLPFKIKEVKVDNELVDLKDIALSGKNNIHISKDFTVLHLLGE
jgi:alpha-glucosidase